MKDSWREGVSHLGVVWRRWAVAMHISCHCTHMSKLYMYIVATYLITFKLKFTHKLLLVQNIAKTYTFFFEIRKDVYMWIKFWLSCYLEHNRVIGC